MYRKILTLLLAAVMVCLVGCGKPNAESEPSQQTSTPTDSNEQAAYYTNHLTGEENLTKEKSQNRPVAIMVNNLSTAQKVQTGLAEADIVYETEVEGGITRLMAVFQDVSKVKKIGTVRSARYAYIDLAMGHGAIYVHHGQEPTYAAPHLKDTQTFVLSTNNAGYRHNNGLSSEHTLYGYGDKIWNTLVKQGYNTKSTKSTNWQSFADKDTVVKHTDIANTVSVPFSHDYKSVFKYDAEKEKYVRYFKTTERKDYFTGESEYFKNVFVLVTDIGYYNKNDKPRKIDLSSGDGYYCVNGTYIPIKWSKGASSSSLIFTNVDGSPLTVNQGNSWVCIKSKEFSPTFE